MIRRHFSINLRRYILPAVILSTLAMIASIGVIAVRGLNYGVDFLGGIKLEYRLSGTAGEGEIAAHVKDATGQESTVLRFGEINENRFLIQLGLKEGVSPSDYTEKIAQKLTDVYGPEHVTLEQEESVGPKAGKDLRNRGIAAVVIALVLVLIYMAYRFDLYFAPGAIIATIHDVVIPLGFFALLGKEFSLPIVAALLTIVGYSLNDTIVIFDRIREHEKQMDAKNYKEIVYKALNSTFSRTIVTSLTTFMVVAVLFFKGGGVIHDFAFAFLIGVVVGVYSSLFVASPIYIFLKGWRGFERRG